MKSLISHYFLCIYSLKIARWARLQLKEIKKRHYLYRHILSANVDYSATDCTSIMQCVLGLHKGIIAATTDGRWPRVTQWRKMLPIFESACCQRCMTVLFQFCQSVHRTWLGLLWHPYTCYDSFAILHAILSNNVQVICILHEDVKLRVQVVNRTVLFRIEIIYQ